MSCWKWEMRGKIETEALTYRESRDEFTLVYVAISTANTYGARILAIVDTG